MHEVSIMAEAVRLAVDAGGGRHVRKLQLRIGVLSGVVPAAMRFAFDVVTRDTLAAGATLEIESVPAVAWCEACQVEFSTADFFSECPRCRKVNGGLRRGREMEIASVELE
jgi:hydrogenase nickel incorporation protein HypA/HybF